MSHMTQGSEKRMINSNELVAKRMEELALKAAKREEAAAGGFQSDIWGDREDGTDSGFSAGLSVEQVEGLLGDVDFADGLSGNVIKANPMNAEEGMDADLQEAAREQLLAETKGAADAFLADAQEKARQEADRLLEAAREQIEAERKEALEEARERGYQEGFDKAEQEFAAKEKKLAAKEKQLEAEYNEILDGLEPGLVEAIGAAYEYLIGVDLASYKDIVVYMISSAMRRIESGKNFTVHISGEDYPYVSMEKKKLEAALASPSATLELVEDTTLSHNECMIETEGGIFDCGLGTQMGELQKRLKLLSYEKKD